jgi:hypothetical protein
MPTAADSRFLIWRGLMLTPAKVRPRNRAGVTTRDRHSQLGATILKLEHALNHVTSASKFDDTRPGMREIDLTKRK